MHLRWDDEASAGVLSQSYSSQECLFAQLCALPRTLAQVNSPFAYTWAAVSVDESRVIGIIDC